MKEILICAFFLAAISLGGYACVALFDRRRSLDEVERWLLAFPSGVGCLGAVLYTLNVCGIPFDIPLVTCVLLAGLAGAGWTLLDRVRGGRPRATRNRHRPFRPGLIGCVALGAAFFVLLNYIAEAYYYPMCQGDTQIYHFPYAAIVFRTHFQPVFGSTAWTEEFSFPPALFLSYAALWTLLGHINQLVPHLYPIPLLLSWCGLTLLAVRRVLRGSDGAACVALLAFVAIYELNVIVLGESTDLLPVVAAGAAAYLLARDLRDGVRERLPVALLLLSVFCWTKYQGVPFGFCVALAWWMTVGRSRGAVREAGWLFIGSLILFSPLMIRNAIHFGNPIYPGAGHLLGGYGTTSWGVNVVGAWWQPAELFHGFPYVLALTLRESPVLIGVPVVWILWRRHDRPGNFLSAAALLFLLAFVGVLSNRTPFPLRFAGPALGILSWLGGSLIDEMAPILPRPAERTGLPASAVAAIWCAITVLVVLADWLIAGKNIFGNGFESWDLRKHLPLAIGQMWWIAPFGLALLVSGSKLAERLTQADRLSKAGTSGWINPLPAAVVALSIGAVALNHNQPFKAITDDSRAGLLDPRWDIRPRPTPLVTWMQSHLDEHAVTYTLYFSRWAVPGMVVAPDDPLLEDIHRPGVTLPRAMEAIRRMGVEYVLDWKLPGDLGSYPPYVQDPIFPRLKSSRYFRFLKSDSSGSLYEVRYPGGLSACRPSPADPMPWLMGFAASGPARPIAASRPGHVP